MKKFFETIKIENGKIYNIEYHNKRFLRTIKENFDLEKDINLKDFINPPKNGLFRCKIIYDRDILKVEYFPYKPKVIKTLKLIPSNIEYNFKYLDRNELNSLYKKRENFDDILIVKDGLITDTSIANIAFFDGKTWLTPRKPLLKGTTREKLLRERKIFLEDIEAKDIKKFKKFALMNAMIGFAKIDNGIIRE